MYSINIIVLCAKVRLVILSNHHRCHRERSVPSHLPHHDCGNIWAPGLLMLMPFHTVTLNLNFTGYYIYRQTRVYACGMDGGLHYFVCIIISVRMAPRSNSSRRYPVYSLFLPVYSFWCMDEFGWGNTRLVIGEGNSKKILMNEDDKYDDSMIPLKKFSGKRPSQ